MKDIFLLDMDETLLDFSRAEHENLRRTFASAGIPFSDAAAARFHKINDALWKKLERGETTRAALIVDRFRLLFEALGIAADAETVAHTYYENFTEICFPFEGAAAFVRELGMRGRVFIVTNGGAKIQHRHIRDGGFENFLSGVFISEEVGASKPSAAFTGYVARHIEGFDPARAVWIGDSLTSDMLSAKGMGVEFVLFAPHGAPQGYDGICCKTYGEILGFLHTC